MSPRSFAAGVLGWLIPGLVALVLALGPESAGGESALLAFLAWWALGAAGCGIAGAVNAARGGGPGQRNGGFGGGLAGVGVSLAAVIVVNAVVEAVVQVLDLGAVALLVPATFIVAYLVGFGIGMVLRGDERPR